MIGVIADPVEHDVVREFFELFKTPWEFYHENRCYEVVLCTVAEKLHKGEKLVVCYSGRETPFDREQNIPIGCRQGGPCFLSYQGRRIPIYGDSITFDTNRGDFLTYEDSREPAAYLHQSRETVLARIGYELFDEVRALLTAGQPIVNASIPALELHIALLRDLITACGVSLFEIPSVPDGYQFIACLTHDVDHPSIREHTWDHTIFGFLFRAAFGSLANLICRRTSFRCLLTNWAAVLKLPFVHLGLAEDFWQKFDDRYLEIEKGLTSTFFFIPFKNYAGRTHHGPAPGFRAARYQAKDFAYTIKKLMTAGHEIGLHGIDTWLDNSQGSLEMEEIRRLSGISEIGVRMHWLYYDEQSPNELEKAGAAYDSTIGYNETVGYRAGTTQAYKPLEASRLLELPMHVMDTALFYSSYLGLGQKDAKVLLEQMVDDVAQYGGCLTVNWHDRSVLPERSWDACYRELIRDMKTRGAWFSTAREATSWFAKRRSVVFEVDGVKSDASRPRVAICHKDNLPGLRFRIHKARKLSAIGVRRAEDYVDVAASESANAGVPLQPGNEYPRG